MSNAVWSRSTEISSGVLSVVNHSNPQSGRPRAWLLQSIDSSMMQSGLSELQVTETSMSEYAALLKNFDQEISLRTSREAVLRDFSAGPGPEELALRSQIQSALEQREQELDQLHAEYEAVLQDVTRYHQDQLMNLQRSHENILQSLHSAAKISIEQLVRQREESDWVVQSVLDDHAEDSPVREFEKFLTGLQKAREEQEILLQHLDSRYLDLSNRYHWTGSSSPQQDFSFKSREKASESFQEAIEAGEAWLKATETLVLPRLFLGFRSLGLFTLLAAGAMIPLYLFVDPAFAGITGDRFQANWIGISFAGGGIAGLLLTTILYTLGSMRQADFFRQLDQAKATAHASHHGWLKLSEAEQVKQEKQSVVKQRRVEKERNQALRRYEETLAEKQTQIELERDRNVSQENQKYESERRSAIELRDTQLQQIEQENQRRITATETRWTLELGRIEGELQQFQRERSRAFAEHWATLKRDWEEANRRFSDVINAAALVDQSVNHPWEKVASGDWTPPTTMPHAIRHGTVSIDLQNWKDAISPEMRLAPRITQFQIPSEVPFPGKSSTLFKSPDHLARAQSIAAIQTMMLRLLLTIPPGKLRFTMIDPVSLGESFGGFMHLADYDEMLVTSRIWTESGQIEARLADLTGHMEDVLQTYLRNEFQTIEEYNRSAGEVAEPYHFLVINDFPVKFSEIAARRLVSIINSGPRCGVYTLLNFDPTKPLPNNFQVSDIDPHMTSYAWSSVAFHATEADLASWPIQIEAPPDSAQFTSIVKMVGAASKDARRVEVSFNRIAPQPSEIWSGDSRYELEIPLGRAGATKLQTMRLGKGTSQHMLVAGKTGSGKSTFLHILVTNLSLHYSPNEVNFFLIDFKKGVEFKDYATCRLPHAQVIAIESDREFGVSALQRLDEVLQERGELFRRHGVQDIAGFRNANPQVPLPRILLIVDEFQEFFIEDDKLGQAAAQLLDRLVRQGRAFGVHVILGSQTLGGAYSLARTTLGQVAVRVALQCSEADAHLILSEENTAARLLTRPGEAIYNDANGMAEGNHPFQIGWLSDSERREYLNTLQKKGDESHYEVRTPVVFEGNIPSDIRLNREVLQLAADFPSRSVPVSAPTIWLGDAVEIRPPVPLQFHRQSGSHLLIVGQDAEAAMGIMTSAAVVLAASSSSQVQHPAMYLFDGNPPGTPESGVWKSVVDSLPIEVSMVSPRQTAETLEQLSQILNMRMNNPDDAAVPVFVFVYHIAKFRDLRKGEDDYGFAGFGSSGAEKPIEPSKLFSTLLTEGPVNGIHFVIWCDSYNNVERSFSRQSLKEFEMRVALQMNAADSSNFIDTPAAARLGTHRALLYREETGQTEKFRPYGVPERAWIEQLSKTKKSGAEVDFATDLEEFNIL